LPYHDAMSDDMINLGKRAVACKGWRWMPGMRTADAMRVIHDPERWPDRPCAIREGGWVDTAPPRPLKDDLPDLTDPATLGCLLALVREAWGDPRAYIRACFGWELITDYCVGKYPPGGDTEAEALVAALEGAP
jgi:hypothetical protein